MRKNSRRMQLEQWLLLAVRTLLIVLLVLAVAEPFLEQHRPEVRRRPSGRIKVLVIDGSFSMDYKPTDKSRFDRAKELAAQIVDESSQGDGFTLVLMGVAADGGGRHAGHRAARLLEEIDNLAAARRRRSARHAGQGRGDRCAARREHGRLTREEVYFITDLGRVTWPPDLAPERAPRPSSASRASGSAQRRRWWWSTWASQTLRMYR